MTLEFILTYTKVFLLVCVYCKWIFFQVPFVRLLVYRKTTDFHILMFYATVLYLLVSSRKVSFFFLSLVFSHRQLRHLEIKQFISSFLIFINFIYFSCFIALASSVGY